MFKFTVRPLTVFCSVGALSSALLSPAMATEADAAVSIMQPGQGAPRMIVLGGGYIGVFRGVKRATYSLEYRFRENRHGFHTAFFLGRAHDAHYINFSLAWSHSLGPWWVTTVSTGPGIYTHGLDGLDLGNKLEFLTRIEVMRVLRGNRRIGLRLAHVSNAHLSEYNPGAESLALTFAIPLGR